MNTAVMTQRIAEASPRFKARIAGAFYLVVFVLGGVAVFVGGRFVVPNDAGATAANILANESSFRFAVTAADLVTSACYVAVTALFYDLFKPVNRSVCLVAAFFSLVGCAIGALSGVFHLAPLAVLGGAQYLSVFTVEQLHASALLFLKLYVQAQSIGLVFFGFYCLLIGYLIFRSNFLPSLLGLLMAFAGMGWLTFLWPPLANYLSPYILAPGIIGEGVLTLWLLAVGVNDQRWVEQAGRSRLSAAQAS